MARTKQSAARSTGGLAPKGALNVQPSNSGPHPESSIIDLTSDREDERASAAAKRTSGRARRTRSSLGTASAVAEAASSIRVTRKKRVAAAKRSSKGCDADLPLPFQDRSDKFCYLCQNGGSCIACTDCPRVVCYEHLPQDQIPTQPTDEGIDFLCPSCHIIWVRQQRKELRDANRRDSSVNQRQSVDARYMAFYRRDANGSTRSPLYTKPVTVQAPTYVAHHARMNTSPVCVIMLRLRTLRGEGSVPRVLFEALKPYFIEEETGNLVYQEVEFDLNCDADVNAHHERIMAALAPLTRVKGARVLMFVYTHADEESGTLFFGANLAAQSIRNWFDVLIPEAARTLLREHDTTMFMLCCGALVHSNEAYAQLKSHCLSLRITRLFAFEARAFQAALATLFFIAYAYKFVLENVTFSDHQLGNVLSQSLHLGRHSKVVMMTSSDDWNSLTVAEYLLSFRGVRPWGEPLPIQCKDCKAIHTYDVKQVNEGPCIAHCTEKGCQSTLTFTQRAGDVVLSGVEGKWLKRLVG